MDIIEKSNLKTKALVIILIATLMLGVSTLFCTVKAANEEAIEAKLNTKIYFEGNTYRFHDGKRVRKEYADGELGCGIVTMILPNKAFGVYVLNEGWISKNQIRESQKYIDIHFDEEALKENGLKTTLTINGEFVNVTSENEGIIKYNDGALEINADGQTTVTITTKEGKEIEALATVVEGDLTLNIPQKEVNANIKADAEIADKIQIEAKGDATAAIVIDEDGLSIAGEGNGDVIVKADEKEIASGNGNIAGGVTINQEGVSAGAEGSQTMNLFQKLTMKLTERLALDVNKEEVKVSAGGDILAGEEEKEIASGDVEISHNFSEEDPKIDAKVEVLDKEVVNVEDKTVPVVSLFKKLMQKVQER